MYVCSVLCMPTANDDDDDDDNDETLPVLALPPMLSVGVPFAAAYSVCAVHCVCGNTNNDNCVDVGS